MQLYTSGANQNSYVTVEEAHEYFSQRLDSDAWTRQDDQNEWLKALATAFRALERITAWRGSPALNNQRTKWPRVGYTRSATDYIQGGEAYYPVETVPTEVKFAQCEEALALLELRDDPSSDKRRTRARQGLKMMQMGSLLEQWGAPVRYAQGNLWSKEAYDYIRSFIVVGGTIHCERD